MQDLASHFSDWPEPLPFEEVPLQPWPNHVFPGSRAFMISLSDKLVEDA